jgi:excisionase family DNA binding protein
MPDHPTPSFLTPRELAARWRLGRSTVYELIARGELPYYRLGKTLRIALADIEAYETTGRVEAPATPLRLRTRIRPA